MERLLLVIANGRYLDLFVKKRDLSIRENSFR